MSARGIITRSAAGASALALSVLGVVAVPGIAHATECTPVSLYELNVDLTDLLGTVAPSTTYCLTIVDGVLVDGDNVRDELVAATDTGRAPGSQSIISGWQSPDVLVWTVPPARHGVAAPYLDLESFTGVPMRLDYDWSLTGPSAPTAVIAEATGPRSVHLTWTEAAQGSFAVAAYDVLYRAEGAQSYLPFDSTLGLEMDITGLAPSTTYEFVVRARDIDDRASEQSQRGSATTDDRPVPQVSTPDAIHTGATATFEVSSVMDTATVEADSLATGVTAVEVDGLTVQVTTRHGFSGTLVQPLTVVDGSWHQQIYAAVTVRPDATAVTHRIISATTSSVRWTAAAGATGYVVKVGSRTVCTTSTLSCSVAQLLGPASTVTVVTTGHDATTSALARSTWRTTVAALGHVHFVGEAATLTASSRTQLTALSARLMAAGIDRVTVRGYTATQDGTTRTPTQLRLSAQRAAAAAGFLVAQYAAHGRHLAVVKVAVGAGDPIASNATYAGRAENRRAEIALG